MDPATRLVLVEPFLLPSSAEQQRWLDDLDGKRAVVARLADERGVPLVPLHRLLTEAAGDAPGALAPDGVHPSPEGARLIADAWLGAYREQDDPRASVTAAASGSAGAPL